MLLIYGVYVPSFTVKENEHVRVLCCPDKSPPGSVTRRGLPTAFRSNRLFEVRFHTDFAKQWLGRVQFCNPQTDIEVHRRSEQQILHAQEPILRKIKT